MPDGGHDVTEVHGGNDAVLLFVLLSKCLACVLQLQLLSNKTRHRKAEPKHRPLKGGTSRSAAYLQELGELEVAEVFLIILPKVQPDEFAVPFEGDVVVHGGLAEDVTHIFCSTNEINNNRGREKQRQCGFSRWLPQQSALCDVAQKEKATQQSRARGWIGLGVIWLESPREFL